MKNLFVSITFATLILVGTGTAYGERYASLAGTGDILNLGPEETALLVFASSTTDIEYKKSGKNAVIFNLGSGVANSLIAPLPLTGPATITSRSSTSVLGFKVVPTTFSSGTSVAAPQGIPSTAVVIPSDATGPVSIIMESSTDMVTWTACQPGSYGASTSARFFRLRGVQSQ